MQSLLTIPGQESKKMTAKIIPHNDIKIMIHQQHLYLQHLHFIMLLNGACVSIDPSTANIYQMIGIIVCAIVLQYYKGDINYATLLHEMS